MMCTLPIQRKKSAEHRAAAVLMAVLFLLACPARAQQSGSTAYWVFFEADTTVVAAHLTGEALARRHRRGSTRYARGDAAVRVGYLAALERAGADVRVVSQWLQAASAEMTPEEARRVATWPFVREVRPVAYFQSARAPVASTAPARIDTGRYGSSREQLAVINAVEPLDRGVDGRGVRLGFLDCTFLDFDHPAFDRLLDEGRLLDLRDFTGRPQSCAHGLRVASVAVGYAEGQLVGPAHGATVLAATTEYAPTETRTEEDYFVQGLEWLEEQGADVVNVSLGYIDFPDEPDGFSYTTDQLDGDTGVTTRAVDAAVARGVVVVVSAGNTACSGGPDSCWYYVGTPADADSAIAVGAIAVDSTLAGFSSRGPTADGRIKPDVVAPGSAVHAATAGGGYALAYGTSFSSPLTAGVVAQMLQVNPDLSPIEVRDILRSTAGNSDGPDTRIGWGVVNAAAAVEEAEARYVGGGTPPPATFTLSGPHPNPFTGRTTLSLQVPRTQHVHAVLVDVLGRVRMILHDGAVDRGRTLSLHVSGEGLAAGLYVVQAAAEDGVLTRRIVHVD